MKKNIWLAAGIAGMLLGNTLFNPQSLLAMSPGRGGGTSIVISSRPSFIDLPDQGFSISIGSPYDIINYDNGYYIYQKNSWYRSSDYRGPWMVIREKNVPDKIRHHRWEDIRRYRDIESQKRNNRNNPGQQNDDRNRNNNGRHP